MRLLLLFPALVGLAGCATGQLARSDQRALAGRVYVVTGASSGFGRGVAELLGAHGAHVVLAARRQAELDKVAAIVAARGGQALVAPTDVSDADAVARLAAAAVARFGRIDVWINNAGVGAIGPFERIPAADHARVVDVNYKGVIFGSAEALRLFKAQGRGVLVNIGSVESRIPLAYHASYAGTKHAVLGLSEAIAEELRLAGVGRAIRVTTVLPWAADTLYWQNTANYSGRTPRMVLMDPPETVARAIVRASLHPRPRVAVGWKAKAALTAHALLPDVAEAVAADVSHRAQMRDAPPAPDTPGSLHTPDPAATGVSGGNRARIKAEDAARTPPPRGES